MGIKTNENNTVQYSGQPMITEKKTHSDKYPQKNN